MGYSKLQLIIASLEGQAVLSTVCDIGSGSSQPVVAECPFLPLYPEEQRDSEELVREKG